MNHISYGVAVLNAQTPDAPVQATVVPVVPFTGVKVKFGAAPPPVASVGQAVGAPLQRVHVTVGIKAESEFAKAATTPPIALLASAKQALSAAFCV